MTQMEVVGHCRNVNAIRAGDPLRINLGLRAHPERPAFLMTAPV